MVVPYPPGGPTDIVARVVSQKLSEQTGQQFVVENRAGAGGNIGAEAVAKAPADGYTLLVATTAHAINPSLFKQLGYDLTKDFAPVSQLDAAAARHRRQSGAAGEERAGADRAGEGEARQR